MSKDYTITDNEDGTLCSDREAMRWLREQIDHAVLPYKDSLKVLLEESQKRSRQLCADYACEYFPTDAEQQAIEVLEQ